MNSTSDLEPQAARALKPYPAYKDSGAEWLGKIPAHWEARRLKSLLRPVDRRSTTGRETLLSLRRDYGVVPYAAHFSHPSQSRSLVGFKLVDADQLVVNRLQANNGLVFCSGLNGLVSPDYSVFEQRMPLDMRFLGFVLRTPPYRAHFRRESTGLGTGTAGFLRLYDNRFLETTALIPPFCEQAAIVRFLDSVDRRIRRYIRGKQKLIALLEEQKQAIIHQAVTGQIDVRTGQPYPAYKSSGVESLADMPEHWARCRLRNVVSVVTTGSRGWSSYACDTGPLFIRVGNLSRGSLKLRFEDVVRLDLPKTSEAGRTRIEAGDLLISVTAYIGSVGVAPEGVEEAYVSQHVARCQPLPGTCARWLGYVLLSTVGQTHGQRSLYGGTKDGLSLDDVKDYPILLPPRREQERVVEWIEGELSSLLKVGGSAKRQIEMVREYRTRLIADVVTGKLDVREAAASLPVLDPLAAEEDPDNGFDRRVGSEGTGCGEEGRPLADVSDARRSEGA